MQPRHVVEHRDGRRYVVALSMLWYLPSGSRLTTFDVIPWQDFGTTAQINQGDFGKMLA